MKPVVVTLILFRAIFASAAPSLPLLHPGGIGGVYKGPNSETIINGPDGSIITSAAEGGEVHTKLGEPIVVAEPEPIIVAPAPVAVVAPAPVVETIEINAPIVEPSQPSSDLVGPSGAISTRGSSSIVAGPASTTITGPTILGQATINAPPIISEAVPISTLVSSETIGAVPIADLGLTGNLAVTASPIIHATGAPILASTAGPLLQTGSPILVSTASPAILSPTATPLALNPIAPPVALSTAATASASPSLGLATVSLGDATGATATASASPHQSVATASSSANSIASATAGPNLAIASVEPANNFGILTSPTALPPIVSSTPILASTPIPTLPGPAIIGSGPGISINGQVDLSDTNRIYLGRNPLAGTNIIASEAIRNLPLRTTSAPISLQTGSLPLPPSSTLATNLISSSIPQEAIISSTLSPISPSLTGEAISWESGLGSAQTSSTIQRGERIGAIRPQYEIGQRIEPVQRIPLSEPQQLALAQQQALLRNDINGPLEFAANGIVSPSRGVLIPNTLSSLNAAEEQAILNAELAKQGINPSQIRLTNVPLGDVVDAPGTSWGRYGRHVAVEKSQDSRQ